MAEFFVPLKPMSEWPKGVTKEGMVKELSARLNREFVGIDFNFSQYIQDNIEEAVSGVKGENSVKIFGADLGQREVDFLIEKEWARSADDILWRRSKLGLRFSPEEVTALTRYLETRT